MALLTCEDCGSEERCEVRRVFARVALATREVLDSTSIADSLDVDALDDVAATAS